MEMNSELSFLPGLQSGVDTTWTWDNFYLSQERLRHKLTDEESKVLLLEMLLSPVAGVLSASNLDALCRFQRHFKCRGFHTGDCKDSSGNCSKDALYVGVWNALRVTLLAVSASDNFSLYFNTCNFLAPEKTMERYASNFHKVHMPCVPRRSSRPSLHSRLLSGACVPPGNVEEANKKVFL